MLTGCGSSSGNHASTSTPSPTHTLSASEKFLNAVHQATIQSWTDGSGTPTDDELTVFPPRWCAALAQGHSVAWILDNNEGPDSTYPVGDNWGTNIIDARTLVVLGVTAYCQRYRNQVTAELRSSGTY